MESTHWRHQDCNKELSHAVLEQSVTGGSRGAMNYLCSVDKDGKVELIAMMWCDHDRRYFIRNAEGVEKANLSHTLVSGRKGLSQSTRESHPQDSSATNVEDVLRHLWCN